jgi:hypothetical protein
MEGLNGPVACRGAFINSEFLYSLVCEPFEEDIISSTMGDVKVRAACQRARSEVARPCISLGHVPRMLPWHY